MSKGNAARWLCAIVVAGLTACGSAPPKPVPTKVTLVAAATVNPDGQGRASPVVVRLYQLKTDAEFADAQLFKLYDDEKGALGASLIARDEFTVNPGEQKVLEVPVSPDARFYGVMAAFRDPAAQWRSLAPAPAKSVAKAVKGLLKEQRFTIRLDKTAVTLTVNE